MNVKLSKCSIYVCCSSTPALNKANLWYSRALFLKLFIYLLISTFSKELISAIFLYPLCRNFYWKEKNPNNEGCWLNSNLGSVINSLCGLSKPLNFFWGLFFLLENVQEVLRIKARTIIALFLYFTDEETEAQSHQDYRSSLKVTILFFKLI